MPSALKYPGVYVEEIPSGVHTIVGVSTSDTAFVDYFARGPMNEAVRITSLEDFTRVFGGLDPLSEASYAIQQFYLNGGQVAWVVRVASGTPLAATLTLTGGSPQQDSLEVSARNEGLWGETLQVAVDYKTKTPASVFNLVVREIAVVRGRKQVVNSEVHRNVSMDKTKPSYAVAVVNAASNLVRLKDAGLGNPPAASAPDVTAPEVLGDADHSAFAPLTKGDNGSKPDAQALTDAFAALDRIDPFVFNILCLPGAAELDGVANAIASPQLRSVLSKATKFCEDKRAFLIVDVPSSIDSVADMIQWAANNDGVRHRNAAVYFPRFEIPDPLNDGRPRNVGASGTMAGVFARTDATRGVWKAPAGTEATLRGVTLPVKLTDLQNGGLNPLGLNVARSFPIFGNVAWGARTLEGADIEASEWKYIPVRRTALYIEESLFEGLKWVVFEPNDEPLWAQIRLNVGAFMQNLFRQGAFQGKTPRDAYFVKCDNATTTQNEIDQGIVNIVVGFAPLKPAEFVVIKIQQIAGQIQV